MAKFKNVCISASMYSLLQYLLITEEQVAQQNTYYFFTDAINETIREKITSYSYYPTQYKTSKKEAILRRLRKLEFILFKYHKYTFLKTADIFAHDISYLSLLIGKRPYSLLAEGPNFMTIHMNSNSAQYQRLMRKNNSLKGKIEKIIYGSVVTNCMGNNNQCKRIYLTEENHSPVIEGKEVIVKSISELWNESSESKKAFVKSIFGLTEHKKIEKENSIMFLTQPFVKDDVLTEKEYIELLNNVFAKYDKQKLLIKRHPRDTFDYTKHFGNIKIYDDAINLELLVIIGMKIQKVVAICSTSVDCIPEDIEVDWYGTGAHPKIEAYLGKTIVPHRKVNYLLQS